MAALARFIPLSEAAQRLRLSVKETRAMIKSGKIQGGILPSGEMIVTQESLPKRKEDLPEYKKHSQWKGVGISINDASREFQIPSGTITRWMQGGIINRLGSDGYRTLIDKADVAYCSEIYHRFGGQGKRLFNPDGTPYTDTSVVARNTGKVRIDVQVGDHVYVYKFLDGGKKVEATGEITEIKYENNRRRKAWVNGQWFTIRNDSRNGIVILRRALPPR